MDEKNTLRLNMHEHTPKKEIRFLQGDATAPQGDGAKIIAHLCNDVGRWEAGFVSALSKRWEDPEKAYREWYDEREDNDFRLGACQLVPVADRLWVANIVGQHGVTASEDGPPVRYAAIELGLRKLADRARQLNADVHMPRIGCGLAGGDWQDIEPLVRSALADRGITVYVYDLG